MSSKKIAVITTYGNFNFGNKLQNYAVEQLFRELGLESYSLKISRTPFKSYVKEHIKKMLFLIDKKPHREAKFLMFNSKYLNYKKNYINPEKYSNLVKEFELFSIGSDQVWNPNYCDSLDFYYLMFVSEDKKIPISPSFGITMMDNYNEYKYLNKYLKTFKYLCCREQDGVNFINSCTDRQCELLIDPTLYFKKDFWDKITSSIEISKNYILAYFLGEITDEYKKELNRISEKTGLTIVYLNESNQIYFNTGPSEFLYLIKNSRLICTDSFHGCVFSFIYEKPMAIFERKGEKMFDRIITLSKKFKFENKLLSNLNIDKLLENDYSEGKKQLEIERNKFREFLLKFL